MMKRKLENRTALITGASRGIGRAIATRFAEEGADLIICARRVEPLEEGAIELRDLGVKVAVHVVDVSDQKSVREMIKHALQEFGQIDILVNNAGTQKAARFIDYTLDDFDRVIKVNLYGVFNVTQAVLPGMMERKKGKIVNVASTAGKWGSINQSAYNTSKHGVVGLTRCIGLEMVPYNINVNAICPGLVETDMSGPSSEEHAKALGISVEDFVKARMSRKPPPTVMKPEEIAYLALYLASDESNSMTCQSIAICGSHIMV